MMKNYGRMTTCFSLATATLAAAGISASAALIDLTPGPNAINSAGSVSLADLQSGQVMGISVGDKWFTGFSYARTGDMPAPADINVLGFRDQNGNWGVTFHGSFLDLPGGGSSDALVRFVAEVNPFNAQRGTRISDAHLFLSGAGVSNNSYFVVDESFLENNQSMHAFKSTIGQGGQQLSDWADFDPTHVRLHVTKDINAFAGQGSILPARATAIDQSFSQITIPEPATAALSAVILGMLAIGQRRRA